MSLPDLELMRLALAEAAKGGHAVRPNPQVGCAVETRSGQILLAHHEKYGGFHAERNAILRAREQGIDLNGARIAVTLEPCSHFGRTPPCVDLLLEEKWSEVLIGCRDPYPEVAGRGIAKLQAAGIPTKVGVLEKEAIALNRTWLKSFELGRAHVTLKLATSMDGRLSADNGQSQWITSKAARDLALQERSRFTSIITGGSTLRQDNPSLTARDTQGRLAAEQPSVFVLTRDANLKLAGYKLAQHPKKAEVVVNADLPKFLQTLLKDGHYDVLLECGPQLAQSFLQQKLVDEIHWYFESTLLGGTKAQNFTTPFNGGALPGLESNLGEIKKISETSFFVQLFPKN